MFRCWLSYNPLSGECCFRAPVMRGERFQSSWCYLWHPPLPLLLSAALSTSSSNNDKAVSHHNTSFWYYGSGYFLWLFAAPISFTHCYIHTPQIFAVFAVEMWVVFESNIYIQYIYWSLIYLFFLSKSCLKCLSFGGNGDLFFFGNGDEEVELELG